MVIKALILSYKTYYRTARIYLVLHFHFMINCHAVLNFIYFTAEIFYFKLLRITIDAFTTTLCAKN